MSKKTKQIKSFSDWVALTANKSASSSIPIDVVKVNDKQAVGFLPSKEGINLLSLLNKVATKANIEMHPLGEIVFGSEPIELKIDHLIKHWILDLLTVADICGMKAPDLYDSVIPKLDEQVFDYF